MQLGDDELVTEAFWSSSDPTMPEESSTLHWPESHCTNHNNAGAVNSPPIDVSSDAYRQSSEDLIMAKEKTNGSASAAEESVEKSPTPSLPPAPASRTKKRKLLAEKYGLAGGGGGQVEEAPPEKKGRIWKIEKRRESIHERLRILQRLFPNGTNVDASTLLDEAARYVQFLHLQIKLLSSDEQWMFAPISYNGTATASDLEISTLL